MRPTAEHPATQPDVPVSKGPLGPVPAVVMARATPSDDLRGLVRHYWIPRWQLPEGESVRQEILEYPSMNLVVEAEVARLYRASRGRSAKTLTGAGWGFGVLLQPGTGRRLLAGGARTVPADGMDLTQLAVAGGNLLAHDVRRASADDAMIAVFEAWVRALELPPDQDADLVTQIVSAVESDRWLLRVDDLAARFDIGVRRLQRLIGEHIGFSPKWLIQRYRLQEAAHALSGEAAPSLAELAASLGYADQAHFSREFKAVIGVTPGVFAVRAEHVRLLERDESGQHQ